MVLPFEKIYFLGFLFICGLVAPQFMLSSFFFLNDPPTTEFYPLPLHDALPIWFASLPVLRLPSTRPCQPWASKPSARCEPMNPAPPVTRHDRTISPLRLSARRGCTIL